MTNERLGFAALLLVIQSGLGLLAALGLHSYVTLSHGDRAACLARSAQSMDQRRPCCTCGSCPIRPDLLMI